MITNRILIRLACFFAVAVGTPSLRGAEPISSDRSHVEMATFDHHSDPELSDVATNFLVDQASHVDQSLPSDPAVLERRLSAPYAETPKTPSVESVALGDVWVLSTRHLFDRPSCIASDAPGFQVYRHDDCRWQSSTLDEALTLDGRLPIIYVHGNFMERNNALQRVLILNEYVKRRAQRPYRLFMLSWPSQREPHPLRDSRENAVVAERQSLFLASVLDRLRDQPQVSLLGFSFGSRCVAGGLHLASGGQIPGMSYASPSTAESGTPVVRVGFVAPAVDRTWLMPRARYGCALVAVESAMSLNNHEDPVLRRFHMVDPRNRPDAAGYQGFVASPLIAQVDCSRCVGGTHDERTYYRQCPYFTSLIDHLLWNSASESCSQP